MVADDAARVSRRLISHARKIMAHRNLAFTIRAGTAAALPRVHVKRGSSSARAPARLRASPHPHFLGLLRLIGGARTPRDSPRHEPGRRRRFSHGPDQKLRGPSVRAHRRSAGDEERETRK